MGATLTEQFVVGIVRGAHGITGEFKVESTSGEYEHFGRMEEVTLTDGTVKKSFKIEEIGEGTGVLYMKLQGINSPEEAAKYNRWEIVVPREYAHPLQEGEWYIEDLKGCSVFYCDAAENAPAVDLSAIMTDKSYMDERIVGTVTDVKEGGSGYLVEILLSESSTLLADSIKFTKAGEPRKVFVPFKDNFIGTVDVEAKMMQLMHLWILE